MAPRRSSSLSLVDHLAKPGKICETRTEAEVFARWDKPRQIQGYLRPGLVFEGWRGVRVVAPTAFVHELPLVGGLVAKAERAAMRSPLARFGGFLVAVSRKA